jgi:hypothetical protein
MTRETSKGLPIAARLALFVLIGMFLPLCAAPFSYSVDLQKTERISLDITTSLPLPSTSPIGWERRIFTLNYLLLVGLVCLTLFLLLALRNLRRKRLRPPSPSAVPSVPHLESVSIPGGPRRFGLQPGGSTIGRGLENDLIITQDFPAWETASRCHARIYQQAGHWIVEDLGATNGVYVNGKRTGRNLLRDGWRLGIGGVEFIFNIGIEETQR